MNRLKELREERGLTQADLAEVIGAKTPQSIGNYELGKRDISTDYLIKFAKFFGVSTDYLLGADDFKSENLNNLFNIPVIKRVTAGKPIFATENIIKYLMVPPEMFSLNEADDLFFLEVSGESMNKVIANGSYVLVKKQDTAENGDIIVSIVNDDDEATLKRFKTLDKKIIMLEPDSTDTSYDPIIIKNTRAQKFRVIGKVIGCFTVIK